MEIGQGCDTTAPVGKRNGAFRLWMKKLVNASMDLICVSVTGSGANIPFFYETYSGGLLVIRITRGVSFVNLLPRMLW